MKQRLIQELKETSFYEKLLFKENTICAYFGGSQLIGFKDEKSDFDIVCLVDGHPHKNEYSEYLMWNEKKVHFIYFDINDLFNPNLRGLRLLTLTQFQALKENSTIFYLKEGFQEKIKYLLDRSDELLKIGFHKMILDFYHLIDEISRNGMKERNKTKFLYHIVYAKRKYLNQSIDENYLTKLKRIRWQEIEDLYIQKCIEDMKELKDYFDNNKFDITSVCKALLNDWCNKFCIK